MPSPSSSIMLPLPGSPSSSWALYKSKFKSLFHGADTSVLLAFWLFGLINNVSYVIILSAALDLVGPSIPKGLVLLADVLPSFLTKLIAPYLIHHIPYSLRILIITGLSATGMFLIALTPSVVENNGKGSLSVKLVGVVMASLASGGGELSFLGLTHYYGPFSLAAWGSGTGGAGLVGAGVYVLLTSMIGLSVRNSLLSCAFLPFVMPVAFFLILPLGPLRRAQSRNGKDYEPVLRVSFDDEDIRNIPAGDAADALLAPGPSVAAEAYTSHSPRSKSPQPPKKTSTSLLLTRLRRARALFIPYMLPLLLVYISEYTINLAISPTLLFPLARTPFTSHRTFFPTYALIYQSGVFISRSSTPFIRIHNLYFPSYLQVLNLVVLTLQSLWFWMPSVWVVFAVVFWEGLLGGAVYVNTFAEIMENVGRGGNGEDEDEREFSLGATSVSDSAGICIAGLIGLVLEPALCDWNFERGRVWCRVLDG